MMFIITKKTGKMTHETFPLTPHRSCVYLVDDIVPFLGDTALWGTSEEPGMKLSVDAGGVFLWV